MEDEQLSIPPNGPKTPITSSKDCSTVTNISADLADVPKLKKKTTRISDSDKPSTESPSANLPQLDQTHGGMIATDLMTVEPKSDQQSEASDGSVVNSLASDGPQSTKKPVGLHLSFLPSPEEYTNPERHAYHLLIKVMIRRIRKVLHNVECALASNSIFASIDMELKKIDRNPPKSIIEAQEELLKIAWNTFKVSPDNVGLGYASLIFFPIYGFRDKEKMPILAQAFAGDLPEPKVHVMIALMTHFHGFILKSTYSPGLVVASFKGNVHLPQITATIELFDLEKYKAEANLGSGIGLLLHNLTLSHKIKAFEGVSLVIAYAVRDVYYQ